MPHECWFLGKTEQVRPGVWWRSLPFSFLKKNLVVVERAAQLSVCTASHGAVWSGRGQSVDDLVGNPSGLSIRSSTRPEGLSTPVHTESVH
jgi:hypothetical protein